jgi:AcrR family transcriptional regulator
MQMLEPMNSTPTIKARARRERLIDATVAETVEHGYAVLTVARIVRRARVSRNSFYAQFDGKQAAVEAAYECLFERYLTRLLQTCEAQSSWPLKVKVGIGATLDMAADSPAEAQFLAVEALTVNGDFLRRVLDSRDRLARLLVGGRTETPHGAELPAIVESALVGAVAGVVATQLRAGEAKHLPSLAPELVELTLTPYLGHEEAAKVARRPRLESAHL